MQFLITNDDGYDAPGLAALYEALRPLGDVHVVAPSRCHSSKGHAVDTKSPLRVDRKTVEPFGQIHIVHSSPADCIRVGLCYLHQQRPDMVVAGINPGANLGVDLFYSGTAAAAREAALLNVPAVAVSRYLRDDQPIHWGHLSQHVRRAIRKLLQPEFQLPLGHFWNLNFPAIQDDAYPDEMMFVPQGIHPHAVQFTQLEGDENSQLLSYTALYRDRGCSDICDVRHVFDDKLTATAVGPNLTAHQHFSHNSRVSLHDAACPD